MKHFLALLTMVSLIAIGCGNRINQTATSSKKTMTDSSKPVMPEAVAAEKPSNPHAPNTPNTPSRPAHTEHKSAEDMEDKPGTIHYPEEVHLSNIRQLTFGGENAEAYFSYDDEMLVLQVTNPEEGYDCDQIFYGKIPVTAEDRFETQLVSTGTGRTTCSFFMPDDQSVIFASTHLGSEDCPPTPDRAVIKKYVWPIYDTFEIFLSDRDGKIIKQYTDNNFYDAEATVSPDGSKVVFTSNRTGDLELYTMNLDGSDVKQVTDGLGYDGGAFFSPDSKQLVFRASRPTSDADIKEYKDLMAQGLVAPTNMELYVCDIDGSNMKQVTNLGKANWAPYFHPSGEKIIFSSNHETERGFPFNLYVINVDGSGLKKITHDQTFDAFPMFSWDGTKLVFSSNRNNGGGRDTNVFIADWVENPE